MYWSDTPTPDFYAAAALLTKDMFVVHRYLTFLFYDLCADDGVSLSWLFGATVMVTLTFVQRFKGTKVQR